MGDEPRLRAIGSYENDPALPNLVWALDPSHKHLRLSTDPNTILAMEDDHLNAKIGEYAGLIHGSESGTNGLLAAHALFAGLKRPCVKPGRDSEICVYVLNPERTFEYPTSRKHTGEGPISWPKPRGSVFVVYADLVAGEYVTAAKQKIATGGSILFWEWVLADPADPALPNEHDERYLRRLW